jgi:hypothetical protein
MLAKISHFWLLDGTVVGQSNPEKSTRSPRGDHSSSVSSSSSVSPRPSVNALRLKAASSRTVAPTIA